MTWIRTVTGFANSDHIVQIVRDDDGTATLHLANGQTVRTETAFTVTDDGNLMPIDADQEIPF